MSSDIAANMRKTSEALLRAFSGQWLAGATLNLRAPNCEHIVLPTSLGVPRRSNVEWEAYFKSIAPLVGDATMIMNDYFSVPDECRAIFRSSMTASTPVGPFNNEYLWDLTFDDKGQKIVRIVEFMDSVAARDILSRMTKAGLLATHRSM